MKIEQMSNSEIYGLIRTATTELENREQRRAKPAASSVEGTTVETIEHEGLMLSKVNREANDDDYIRANNQISALLEDGVIYGPASSDFGDLEVECDGTRYSVYADCHNRTLETVEVFEVVEGHNPKIAILDEVVETEHEPLTANQQRAELIKWARKLATDRISEIRHNDIEFVVNVRKRTVVALARNKRDKKVWSKGIAKCHPNDVFNADIGKFIALHKLKGIDAPSEFLDAVQPTEIVPGMVVGDIDKLSGISNLFKDYTVSRVQGTECWDVNSDTFARKRHLYIIEDSNAIYEV